MTDEEGFRELNADIDLEALQRRLEQYETYYRMGFIGGVLEAMIDALKAKNLAELLETLVARIAPTVGGEQ